MESILYLTLISALIILLILLLIFARIKYKNERKKYLVIKTKYQPITNIEEEVKRIQDARDNLVKDLDNLASDFKKRKVLHENIVQIEDSINERIKKRDSIEEEIENLKSDYKTKKIIYDDIVKELSILGEDLEDLSFGLYKPHFEFDYSESYKVKLTEIKELQRTAVRDKEAAFCSTNWTVNDSVREGRKLTNRNIKLMLRAFNGECDAAVSNVRWNNILKLEERIKKSFELINSLGETSAIYIQESYLALKLNELRLTFEYAEKKHEEKEEQRRIREQMREEQKVLKEIELAKREAEKEESKYMELLDKAKLEIQKKHGEELIKFNERIKQLENELAKARELKERAISRAQITKSGHVYIISNVGSFGKDVYKIGMTRRLEPIDRVYELSGASVPFSYDIHGMIYSEDAPGLENELHKIFDHKRVNRVNTRKEFFKVTLDEVEDEIKKIDENLELIKIAEARQYRETMRIEEDEDKEDIQEIFDKFPDEL